MKCAMAPTRMYQIQSRRAERMKAPVRIGVGWEQDGSAHFRVLQQGARGVAGGRMAGANNRRPGARGMIPASASGA